MFQLTWEPAFGGSSLRIAWSDVLELDVKERDWLLERIREQRDVENKALKSRG